VNTRKPIPGISIHFSITKNFELVNRLTEEALNLHAKIIRFDIWWNEVVSRGGFVLRSSLAWYKNLVIYMLEKGLIPLVILGSGVTKRSMDRSGDDKRFLGLVYSYAYSISKTLKPYVNFYQLGNELNNPLLSIPWSVRYSFVEELCRGVADGSSRSIKILNINIDVPRWERYIEETKKLIKECIDIIGVDHYPNTWSLPRDNYWKQLQYLLHLLKFHDKQLAITEVGYASELRLFGKTILNREKCQAMFIENIFQSLDKVVEYTPLAFVIWYMLWDEDPTACEPISGFGWCGWGVLRKDFSRKPGWYLLKKWFKYLIKESDGFNL
jgi:hypothetical protein